MAHKHRCPRWFVNWCELHSFKIKYHPGEGRAIGDVKPYWKAWRADGAATFSLVLGEDREQFLAYVASRGGPDAPGTWVP